MERQLKADVLEEIARYKGLLVHDEDPDGARFTQPAAVCDDSGLIRQLVRHHVAGRDA
jgi:hypothetical protein